MVLLFLLLFTGACWFIVITPSNNEPIEWRLPHSRADCGGAVFAVFAVVVVVSAVVSCCS